MQPRRVVRAIIYASLVSPMCCPSRAALRKVETLVSFTCQRKTGRRPIDSHQVLICIHIHVSGMGKHRLDGAGQLVDRSAAASAGHLESIWRQTMRFSPVETATGRKSKPPSELKLPHGKCA